MMNENQRLPDGWRWVTLADVAELRLGKMLDKEKNRGDLRPYIRNINVRWLTFDLSDIQHMRVLNSELENISVRKDDLVICEGGEPGRAAVWNNDEPMVIQKALHRVRLSDEVLPTFVAFCLFKDATTGQLEKYFTGSTIKHFTGQSLRTYKFALPPVGEQKRIVNKIEELFSDIDAGATALERVQAGLRRYKTSVLKDAFEGKLVPPQASGESVKELLERVIGKDHEKKIVPSASSTVPFVPSGWVYGKLENLIYIAGRIGWRGLKADEYTEDGPMFLSVYNLNMGDHVDFSDTYHISQERFDESPEIMLCENDILLAKDGAGIGKIGIVKGLPGLATVNSSLLVIRASEIFIPEFLFYFLKGPQMQDVVRARITGSATPHLFQRDIKQFTLLIPPLEEQRRIVAEVERRLSVARQVESAVGQALVRASRLRQAVLKSAFEGRLA